MVTEEDKQFSTAQFWDDRYNVSNDDQGPTHEWLRAFNELVPFLQEKLFDVTSFRAEDNPLLLHLGSGDSVSDTTLTTLYEKVKHYYSRYLDSFIAKTIPADLAHRGYKSQICVDFSPVVVKMMRERHGAIEGIEWREMDVRDMVGIGPKSITVAFDKSTLDAMVYGSPWNPPAEVRENVGKYLREVHRTLADDGRFLLITFRQPHFLGSLLNPDGLWNLEVNVLAGRGMLDYYGYVMTKA